MRLRTLILAAVVTLPIIAGCGTTGPYTWVDSMPASGAANANDVIVQEGDILSVRVFKQDELSTKERVRADGKIAMPVIGEVMVRGKRPSQLAGELQERLKAVVVAPSVTVSLEQPAELKVSVVGEVRQSGIFPLEPGATVLTALAAAGGLNDYADPDKVFVVRKTLTQRVRFRYSDLRSAETKSIHFTLLPGDTVVVE